MFNVQRSTFNVRIISLNLLTLLTLLNVSSCTFGPVTPTRAMLPEPEELKPAGVRLSQEGLYFRVLSNSGEAREAAAAADRIYQDILADIKLTDSIRPYSLYPLYLYATKEEYLAKTGMPSWSGGVFDRGRIFLYSHSQTERVLAHEISHLIFWEFFNGPRNDLLWLNEGLAMRAEYKSDPLLESRVLSQSRAALGSAFIPLRDLVSMRTALDHKEKEAQVFYIESWMLARFLINEGGNVAFYELLKLLKRNYPFDRAISFAFPGKWPTLEALEAAFRQDLNLAPAQ